LLTVFLNHLLKAFDGKSSLHYEKEQFKTAHKFFSFEKWALTL